MQIQIIQSKPMCEITNGKNIKQGNALSGIEDEYFSSSEVDTETSYAGKQTQAKPQFKEEQKVRMDKKNADPDHAWSLSQSSR